MMEKPNQSSNGSQEDQFEKEAMTVSSVSIVVNVLLSLFKLLAGAETKRVLNFNDEKLFIFI